MGSVISQAANGIGSVVGNAFSAPFKTIFGASCEDICTGPWDALCFIEHLCVSNLVKLLLILGLCYIGFLFFYLSFQLGICQCIGKSLCNMCWAAWDGYWHGLKYITCFCWYKLKNTKRVYRRRRRQPPRFSDIESSESASSYKPSICRKRKSVREGRKAQFSSSRYSSHRHHHRHHHHRHHLARGISLRVKGGSDRLRINSRKLHIMNAKSHKRNAGSSKRRRLR